MLPPGDDNYELAAGMRQGGHSRAQYGSQVYENEDFYEAPDSAADDEPVVCDNEDFHESEDSDEPEICEDGIRLQGCFLPHREQPVNPLPSHKRQRVFVDRSEQAEVKLVDAIQGFSSKLKSIKSLF